MEYTYRGYRGEVEEVDSRVGSYPTLMWRGKVAGIKDVVTFVGEGDGNTIAYDTWKQFVASVDDYLTMCRERGEEPEQPTEGTPSASHAHTPV